MLVLTRKTGEAVRIGAHIRIRVLEQTGRQVKLGIEAPRELTVVREELFQSVAEANRRAAEGSDGERTQSGEGSGTNPLPEEAEE